MSQTKLTAERLRELLNYDPETGLFTWRVTRAKGKKGAVAGGRDDLGYVKIGIDGGDYRGQRLAWLHYYGEWPARQVDHIDGNPENNAIANLRDVDTSLNQQNIRKAKSTNKSGLIGVSRKAKCSIARINVDGEVRYLGAFKTDAEAHAVYLDAKRRFHPGCTI